MFGAHVRGVCQSSLSGAQRNTFISKTTGFPHVQFSFSMEDSHTAVIQADATHIHFSSKQNTHISLQGSEHNTLISKAIKFTYTILSFCTKTHSTVFKAMEATHLYATQQGPRIQYYFLYKTHFIVFKARHKSNGINCISPVANTTVLQATHWQHCFFPRKVNRYGRNEMFV